MPDRREVFYILDTPSLVYKVFNGLPISETRDGLPNNAVEGMIRAMETLTRVHSPNRIAAAWGCRGRTFRHEVYEQYKANRTPMPRELERQMPYIREVLDAYGVTSVTSPTHESDDVVATLAVSHRKPGWLSVIVSTDKDFRQLLCDDVEIFDHRKNRTVTARSHEQEWGIRADQVADFQALTGDQVDNIPGVPGIGKVYAKSFLETYGTLQAILDADDDEIKGSRHRKIKDNVDKAKMSLELVTLKTDIPLDVGDGEFRCRIPDYSTLESICMECGLFHRASEFHVGMEVAENCEEWG